ncbi:MAG: SDR family oxidoreductase [Anaerolineales bacterium]|nr:SDR family oxidoreductase [Anaerolineales bacterium]
MTRLLVTGASGLLGTHLVLEAMNQVEVIAVSNREVVVGEGVHGIQTDLTQPGSIQALFERFEPHWVVNCAAQTDVDACEEDFEAALELNRDVPARLAQASRTQPAKLIHISTDAVFDGKSGNYVEENTPAPVNKYGRSKLEGERAVLAADPGALVLRTNFFGWSAGSKTGLFEWFYQGLRAGESRHGFRDVFVSLISANHLAGWIMRLLRIDLHGLYHLSSSDCMSKYAFGKLIAEEFSLSGELIQPISVDDANLRVARAKNLCLSTEKFSREIGVDLPTILGGIKVLKECMDGGFREKQRALLS